MKNMTFVLSLVTAGLLTVPALAAQAGCCDAGMDAANCPGMSETAQTNTVAGKLAEPAASVYENYGRIQTALAKDSLDGVATSAKTIAAAVRADASKSFSDSVAQQADATAKATDLAAARQAFKPLSEALIAYAAQHSAVGHLYRQAHCPMANASWLQTGSMVMNPYLGQAMPHCGEFVAGSPAASAHPGHSMPMN